MTTRPAVALEATRLPIFEAILLLTDTQGENKKEEDQELEEFLIEPKREMLKQVLFTNFCWFEASTNQHRCSTKRDIKKRTIVFMLMYQMFFCFKATQRRRMTLRADLLVYRLTWRPYNLTICESFNMQLHSTSKYH